MPFFGCNLFDMFVSWWYLIYVLVSINGFLLVLNLRVKPVERVKVTDNFQ